MSRSKRSIIPIETKFAVSSITSEMSVHLEYLSGLTIKIFFGKRSDTANALILQVKRYCERSDSALY